MITKVEALVSLRPDAQWVMYGDEVKWASEATQPPTELEIQNEIARLQAEYDAQAYARSRSAEYPPITDYLDGVVKGDQAQIDAYIVACQAVKAKYPKV